MVAYDDCANFNHSQDNESVVSHDSDLASAASFVDEEYFLQQRELQQEKYSITSSMADLLASTTKEDDYDRNLGYYGAITDSMDSSLMKDCDIRPGRTQFGSFMDPEPFPSHPNINLLQELQTIPWILLKLYPQSEDHMLPPCPIPLTMLPRWKEMTAPLLS